MILKLIQWMYYLCAMITMVAVGEWTYHWSTKDKKRWMLAGIIYAGGFVDGIVVHEPKLLHVLIFYMSEMIAWSLICDGKRKVVLVRVFALGYIVGIVESLTSVLTNVLFRQVLPVEIVNIANIMLTFGFWRIVTKRSWYHKLVAYLTELSGGKKVIITFVIITGVIVSSFGNTMQKRLGNNGAVLAFRIAFAIMLCMVLVTIIWLIVENYQRKYYAEQNALKEEYIRVQQDYYAAIYEKDRELRRFRHDVANQLGVLRILLERGEVEEAVKHLQDVSEDFSQASFEKIQVGDELLNAILSMMNQKAAEQGVGLHVAGELQRQGKYDVYSLCTIFSNAISNGIEACTHLQQDKVVEVKMVSHNGTLCCIFENPATEAMYQATLRGETSKADKKNHGHGVWNIKKAVEQLGGNMEYQFADGKIKLEVYI